MLLESLIGGLRASDTWGPLDDRYYMPLSTLGLPSDAGVDVSPERALTVSTVFRAVNVLASAIAMVPLCVFKRTDGEGKEKDPGHYAYRLLHDKPNAFQTSFRWRHHMMLQLLLRGNAYYEIIPGGGQQLFAQLRPLHPDATRVSDQLADGSLVYVTSTRSTDGRLRRLSQSEVLHLRGMSSNGITGVSVIAAMRNAVGLAVAAERHGSAFLRNGARPSVVIKHPKNLGKGPAYDRLKASFAEAYGGSDNAGKIPILEEGAELQPITMTAEDAQYIETRQFMTGEFLRFVGVPGVLAGVEEKTTTWGSGVGEIMIGFTTYSVMPWTENLAAELTDTLIVDPERNFVGFELKGLLKGDVEKRFNAFRTAVTTGWMTRNEVRRAEDMNADDPALDEFLEPLNMVKAGEERPPSGQAPGQVPETRKEAPTAMRARAIVAASAARLVRREIARIKGTPGQKGLAVRWASDAAGWARAVADFYGKHAEVLAEALSLTIDEASDYCDAQAAALVEHGAGVVESWEPERTQRLVALALGEED